MKKIILGLYVLGFMILYISCEKDSNPVPSAQQEELIIQITSSSDITQLDAADLPAGIVQYVSQHHAPFEIEGAFLAQHLGYEVTLENGLCLFFDINGNHLNHEGMHDDWSNHHGWGVMGSHCLIGDTLDLTALPESALDYIGASYTGSTITFVVIKPNGKFGVELNDGQILIFSHAGEFIHICNTPVGGGSHGHSHGIYNGMGLHCDSIGPNGQGGYMGQWHQNHGGMNGHHGNMGNPSVPGQPCWGGAWISTDNLPEAIISYVIANHPDATIYHAIQTYSGNYFLRLTDCSRMVFDENGNILFDSGN
jgi:hypothetical protein